MSIALSEFWTRLVRAGITDAAGCKKLAAGYAAAHEGTPPSEAETLAKFMVESGELTEFQARSLLADQPQPIRLANFLLCSPTSTPPIGYWCEVKRLEDGESGVLFRATAQHLSGGREQWLDAHSAITEESLQSFESQTDAGLTLVFSKLPRGRCLHGMIGKGNSLSPKQTCQIGISIAEALAALHARPLIHGSVRPDRVWMTNSGNAILLRDPSGPPLTPIAATGNQTSWLDQLDAPEEYAAPEFADDQQVCNQSTDLYSLGCLLFRLVSGHVPFRGNSFHETVSAHSTETPAELAAAIEQGEAGDPLYRVIAFAMAKNPSARFASATQLVGALRATLPLLPELPETKPTPATQQNKVTPAPTKPDTPQTKGADLVLPEVKSRPLARSQDESQAKAKSKPQVKAKSKPPAESKSPAKPARRPEGKNPTAKPTPAPVTPTKISPAKPAAPPKPRPDVPNAKKPPKSTPTETPVSQATVVAEPQVTVTPDTPPSPAGIDEDKDRSPSRPVRRRKKKKNHAPLYLGAMCVLVLMLLIGLIVRDPNTVEEAKKKDRPKIPAVIPPVSNRPATTSVDQSPAEAVPVAVQGYELVEDDRLLFVPPFAADSPSTHLELLPPGPAAILSVRLASITENSLGAGLIDSLSPELTGMIEAVSERSGVPTETIKRCHVAMHPGKDGWPEMSLAIELKEPLSSAELIEKWQVTASRTSNGATIYAGDSVDGDAYYFLPSEDGSDSISRFAVGSVAQISEVAAAEGGAAPLPRSLQALWNGSSEQADLVVLITPNFMFADGRSMLQSSAPELVRPLKSLLIPDVAGALVTAHAVDQQLYVEARFAPSGGISEPALMRRLNDAVQAWPSWADEFIVRSVPDPSWRLLASRLPSMMRFVVEQTRFGISDGAVIANMYLPRQAVPQVTLATLLAMNTSAGAASEVVATPTAKLSIEEMLARTMSVSFEQESLQFAIDAIVGDYQRTLPAGSILPPIKILGGDLQTMGITQNQQVRDFEKKDIPLRTVLTDLVLGANPDKSATGPKDPKQALIWVLADDPEKPGQKAILVTTRQAAQNKYELPEEFQLEP